MRVGILGGGPGGLYFSALWKSRHPDDDVRLFEQNPADATWGFGVVFSDRALEFLREDDADTVDLIAPRMETWRDITIVHRGETIAIDGVGFSAIGRLELLQLLQQRARAAGVTLAFGTTIGTLDDLGDCDLIVAADGVNSLLRRTFESEFRTSLTHLDGKFVWYGTTKRFETLTQTFVENELGTFNAHHYRYAPDMSTFIVECDPATWVRAGLDRATEDESRAHLRAGIRRNSGWASARLQSLHLAQFPVGVERALVGPQRRADRRRLAHRALFHRLGHAARHRGRSGPDQGAGSRTRRSAAALDRYEAPGGRSWKSWSPRRRCRQPGTSASPSTCGSRPPILP